MTPQELEIARLNARLIALESLVAATLTAATRSPAARQSLLETLDQFAESADSVAFPERGAEYSDLLSDEIHSAFKDLANFLKKHLKAR